MTDRWLKIPAACKCAGMSRPTLMRCIEAGHIRATKRVPGGWVVDRLSIDEYNQCGFDEKYERIKRRCKNEN